MAGCRYYFACLFFTLHCNRGGRCYVIFGGVIFACKIIHVKTARRSHTWTAPFRREGRTLLLARCAAGASLRLARGDADLTAADGVLAGRAASRTGAIEWSPAVASAIISWAAWSQRRCAPAIDYTARSAPCSRVALRTLWDQRASPSPWSPSFTPPGAKTVRTPSAARRRWPTARWRDIKGSCARSC